MVVSTGRIPMIQTRRALTSLRDSGYTLPAALGEPIDNSIEADANSIWLVLSEAQDRRGKKHIDLIAVVDDGKGMSNEVLHHYPQLGFSTRYMQTDTIGKYGVGAKLAALNFGQRIDVWSRTAADEPWRHVWIDLESASEEPDGGEELYIEEPDLAPVPDEFTERLPEGSGTLVVWSKVDRLEEGRFAQDANALRVEIERELSRMFRYYLNGGISISVNGKELLPHDPLFLLEGTWADEVLTERLPEEKKRSLKGSLEHFAATVITKEPIKVGSGTATLAVTLYPPEVTRVRGQGGDELARKLRVPENQGAISFVRHQREINYTLVPRMFPRGVEEADRFIGIELAFTPELDSYFGVRNVKRGVEPHEELRNSVRKLLQKYVPMAREELERRWGAAARATQQHQGEHTAVVDEAAKANRVLPKSRAKGPEDTEEQRRILDDLAQDVVGQDNKAREAYLEGIKDKPFVVESVDYPGTTFIDVTHLDGKVIIRLNTRHRFYRELWEPIRSIAMRPAGSVSGEEAVRTAQRTIEALTLLLIAYGKAESMDDNPRERYNDLRMFWGQFLDSLMGKVNHVL